MVVIGQGADGAVLAVHAPQELVRLVVVAVLGKLPPTVQVQYKYFIDLLHKYKYFIDSLH